MYKTWIRESSFNIEKGGMKMWSGGRNFVCVFGGLWKISEVKGEGVTYGSRTKSLITWAGLARFAETSAP